MRKDGRQNDQLRNVKITKNYLKNADGSVLIEVGDTKVICTATIEDKVPAFKKNSGEGWLTAEYSMLPRATKTRNQRDINKLKLNGRSQEIQRLIGRSLRSVVNFSVLGEREIVIDCDVIQADGGTRTASITGAYVALVEACKFFKDSGILEEIPITDYVGAISVGVVEGEEMLDLCYEEDSNAQVDMNIIMSGSGEFIEIQGTGEKSTFSRQQVNQMMEIAEKGIYQLIELQKQALGELVKEIGRVTKDEKTNCSQ